MSGRQHTAGGKGGLELPAAARYNCEVPGGELGSTGQLEVRVACRGWSVGHVKS